VWTVLFYRFFSPQVPFWSPSFSLPFFPPLAPPFSASYRSRPFYSLYHLLSSLFYWLGCLRSSWSVMVFLSECVFFLLEIPARYAFYAASLSCFFYFSLFFFFYVFWSLAVWLAVLTSFPAPLLLLTAACFRTCARTSGCPLAPRGCVWGVCCLLVCAVFFCFLFLVIALVGVGGNVFVCRSGCVYFSRGGLLTLSLLFRFACGARYYDLGRSLAAPCVVVCFFCLLVAGPFSWF